MKSNKYNYSKVIQQSFGQGWEDVSEYESNSQGIVTEMSGKFTTLKSGRKIEISAIKHDLAEYRLLGYPTRVIFRKTLV
jgi:hypothetical protein